MNIWNVKIWLSQSEIKIFSLFHKCSLYNAKQASKNVADTTFNTEILQLGMVKVFPAFYVLLTMGIILKR